MFDLDPVIVQWRRQMLAGGIKNPVLLDELECHLRDDLEAQMDSGSDAREAFEIAARRMGQATALRNEFQKTKSNELMKQQLRNILVIVAILATGLGLIMPYIAKWRVHETLAAFDTAAFIIGMALFASGAVYGTRFIAETLKKRPEA